MDRKRSLMKKRLECVQNALRYSVCQKTLSLLFDARQYQLKEFQEDYSKQEEELRKLIKQKEAIDRESDEVKAKAKEMRRFIYAQSGMYHCGNNPNPNDFTCKCGTERCQQIDKTELMKEVCTSDFSDNCDNCQVGTRTERRLNDRRSFT